MRRGDKANNVAEGAEEMEGWPGNGSGGGEAVEVKERNGGKKRVEFIAFRSKVVSRTHAELWVDETGLVRYMKWLFRFVCLLGSEMGSPEI